MLSRQPRASESPPYYGFPTGSIRESCAIRCGFIMTESAIVSVSYRLSILSYTDYEKKHSYRSVTNLGVNGTRTLWNVNLKSDHAAVHAPSRSYRLNSCQAVYFLSLCGLVSLSASRYQPHCSPHLKEMNLHGPCRQGVFTAFSFLRVEFTLPLRSLRHAKHYLRSSRGHCMLEQLPAKLVKISKCWGSA
jgi:hypothetical protein